jgi:hypothetical protein
MPVDELIDRLAFSRSPTTSVYIAGGGGLVSVQQWSDDFFRDYTRASVFRDDWLRRSVSQGGVVLYAPR